jgi:hypothetical protein
VLHLFSLAGWVSTYEQVLFLHGSTNAISGLTTAEQVSVHIENNKIPYTSFIRIEIASFDVKNMDKYLQDYKLVLLCILFSLQQSLDSELGRYDLPLNSLVVPSLAVS